MFRTSQPNTYDDIVVKTTDENLTSENWELILNLCDKVQDDGEQGARNVIAAVLKRLAHRNPNVQLYTLSLAEALSKNCTIDLHRELASRAFTQALEKLITDRNTHEKVRRRALTLIAMWTADFENDSTLGLMEECYDSLKAKGYKFEAPDEAPPIEVDDEVRRREEEELQRVLEMSVHDKGGRAPWESYSLASSNGAGASGSGSSAAHQTSKPASSSTALQQPTYGGYVPSTRPAAVTDSAPSTASYVAASPASDTHSSAASIKSNQEFTPLVTRVRALHTFEPTESGELAFEKGEVIKVVDRGYKDWWRGQLKGRTGIFPVNYVEPLPEPTAAELAREAEQEAAVFNQAANVDRLLTLLRGMDPIKDNLADNEEIQELYRSCMTLRPKIVKLIDKYSQKRADLVSMNETFVKARTIFDRMMEESLAKHTAVYDGRPGYTGPQPYIARPESRTQAPYALPGGPQPYGWNPVLYDKSGYNGLPTPQTQPYVDPQAYAQRTQSGFIQPQPYGAPQGGPTPYNGQPEPQIQSYPGNVSPQLQHHSQPAQNYPQGQPQPQPQQQPQQQQLALSAAQSGPPYVYDPNTKYADPNVHAWAQYYAQGGTDLTGTVYFISVPGLKEGPPNPNAAPTGNASQTSFQETAAQAQPAGTSLSPYDQGQYVPVQQQQYGPGGLDGPPASQGNVGAPSANSVFVTQPQPGVNVTPGSPILQRQQPQQQQQPQQPQQQQQQFYQNPAAAGSVPSMSPSSAPVSNIGQPHYGASPYAAAPSPSAPTPGTAGQPNPGAWQGQYHGLTNQFAAMDVGGGGASDQSQNVQSGPQGVGAHA